MKDTARIDAALRASFIFPLLGPVERLAFIEAGRSRRYESGQPIFSMGEPGTSMMLLESGEVRISYPSADGKVVILSELQPGAVFGEIAMLDGGARSADATAATNCTVMAFEREHLMEMLRSNWSLAEGVLKLVCARLRRSDERMADLAFFDLPARLAKIVLARAKAAPAGGPLRLSDAQSTLASLAGASRETVNRCLRRWEKDGLVLIEERRIVLLKPDALRAL
ncbi:Crp/Fnr family transcriptional regulator [Devosia sp.]|uniref:Crp/Fnr family transcriptional regulator n=1 Tax=Devosia sp. TaxID=1871048 RepID=UPI0035B03C05